MVFVTLIGNKCVSDEQKIIYLKKTEYGILSGVAYEGWHSDRRVSQMLLHFKAPEDGLYLIEGWENPHREPNKLKNEDFLFMKSGDVREFGYDKTVYRIDIVKIVDNKSKRTTIIIPENQGLN